jgi:Ssp1 endopeptidase immunity protein Rap1a
MWRASMLVLPALLACSTANASDASTKASDLHKFCKSKDREDVTLCEAYLGGLMSGLMLGTIQTKDGKPFCIPDGVTTTEAMAIFEDFAQGHPGLLHLQQDGVAAAAFILAFPCLSEPADNARPTEPTEYPQAPEGAADRLEGVP